MSEKKWATRQSFIRKEITTNRIGTLATRQDYQVLRYAQPNLMELSVINQLKALKISKKQ